MTLNFSGNAINKVPVGGGGGESDVDKAYVDAQDRTKINKQQDVSDVGKYLVVGSNGIIIPGQIDSANIKVTNAAFQVLTANILQIVIQEIDNKIALFENSTSLLYSLEPLKRNIGEYTEVDLASLQTQMVDSRPSHKAVSANVYDDFGTNGIIDHIEGTTAYIMTIVSKEKRKDANVIYYITKTGLGDYRIDGTPNDIRQHYRDGSSVQLAFEDTITQTGEQLYDFETFKEGYAIFRRNVTETDKVERINIKVDYRGVVTFTPVEYKGTLYWSGTSDEYQIADKKDNTIYRLTDTNEVFLGTIKLSV